MDHLYPFLMAPLFDRRPWGARDLSPIYARKVEAGEQPIGESWLTGDHCRVLNGPLGGATLGELCTRYGSQLTGSAAAPAERFPLLMKFLFPTDKLSVQVHPDDEMAQRLGQPCGKTECWYVVHAQPGAQIALGLKSGVTTAEFEISIREERAETLLNWIEVHAGDMIYVDAGTVHTLGGGSVILETQQNSDTTFRLYDYGRPRELHVTQGLAAIKERTAAGKVAAQTGEDCTHLIATPSFLVDKISLDRSSHYRRRAGHSAQVLVAIQGCGVLESANASPLSFATGDAVVIPATVDSYAIRPQWEVEFVRAELP